VGRSAIKSRDRGYNALTKRIYGMGKVHLKVGVFSSDPKKDHKGNISGEVTVLMVAEWMEFGTAPPPLADGTIKRAIPARSFIRAWFDENEPANKALIASALRAVARGAISKHAAMERLGLKFVAGIQARMAAGIPPLLADSTIKRKGSSTPLIDTGQLRSSITFEVKD
jgi:hypothetical protein